MEVKDDLLYLPSAFFHEFYPEGIEFLAKIKNELRQGAAYDAYQRTLRFRYNFSYTYMVAYPIKMSGQMSGHSFRSYQSYLYEKHLP